MRVEPFTVGSYIHVLKRGARGLQITSDESDRYRFLKLLFYMNDNYLDENWFRLNYASRTNLANSASFFRPEEWPPRKPLVKILCYTLMPNHFHLLLQEISEGGVSKFMQKIGMSMSKNFNEKYDSKGSLFQGGYKGRVVEDDRYLRYVAAYIMTKNTFELYPKGGLKCSIDNFDNVWKWAVKYKFSSLANYADDLPSPIIDKEILGEVFGEEAGRKKFKSFSKEVILGGKWQKNAGEPELHRLAVE